MSFDTTVVERSGSYTVELWADQAYKDLLLVPPMTWQASLYIHKRKLAVYN